MFIINKLMAIQGLRQAITLMLMCCLSVFYIGLGSCSNTPPTGNANPEQVALTDSILLYFQQEQFDKIVAHFDDKVKTQLNAEQLAVVWAQLNAQVGKYSKSEFQRSEKQGVVGDKIVYESYFGSQKLYFQLFLGKNNRIIGLFFKPQP